MKLFILVVFLILINPIYANDSNISDFELLLEYYNPETLLYKPSIEIIITRSDGKRLEKPIDERLAKQVLKAGYNFYNKIFPGEIIFEKEKLIGIMYIIPCSAGGFCEYEKLVILKNNGEFIDDFEFGKYLSDNSGRLTKENVYKSDSLMIFKTSNIKVNPKYDSITSIKIEMETINISDTGEITVVDKNKIDTRRKYYWISTEIAADVTLAKYNKSELAEMRNEIFASHGYIFKSEKWRNYFESEDWYEAQFENVNESLSIIERINTEKILRHENDEIYWKKYEQDVIHYSNKQDSVRYEIQYPSNWFVKIDSFSTKYYTDILLIENIKEKVIVAGGGPFTEHGSFFKIAVLFTSRGKNIEESIMNSDLPEKVKKHRLEQVTDMEIGGIKTLVWVGTAWANHGYEFIYNGRRFRISCMSGSKEQYKIDLPIFQKMVESFKIIK
jgi:hypothetical protein